MTLSFLTISVTLCAAIILRRIWRNRLRARRSAQKAQFQKYILDCFTNPDQPSDGSPPNCHINDIAEVLLNCFRNFRGQEIKQLKTLLVDLKLEDQIIRNLESPIRGARAQCLRVLSYLDSPRSLRTIYKKLFSRDPYIMLTASKGLVRRGATRFIRDIIARHLEMFPESTRNLSSMLAPLGKDAVAPLEALIVQIDNPAAISAALETIFLIRPNELNLDLVKYLSHPTPEVRASALELSYLIATQESFDPLKHALTDPSSSVRIRAVKIAHAYRRNDLTIQLFKLSNDSALWVRYWAIRAIWSSGSVGEKFIRTLNGSNDMATEVMKEMESAYV